MRFVALLRGVNVGGNNRLPMSDLRSLFEELGFSAVVTYIQSGNVVFDAAIPVDPESMQRAIAQRFGIDTPVVVRDATEIAAVSSRNPYSEADPSTVHVGFLAAVPDTGRLDAFDLSVYAPDAVTVVGRDVYFSLPNGMGRSKLVPWFDRKIGVPMTVRNWKTVTKLTELVAG